MATTRTANAHWEGSLIEGAGNVSLDSSDLGSFDVTWASRSEKANGKTSPEELIAAAHSTCFSMALSHALAGDGHAPQAIDTRADVDFQPGQGITGIKLTVRGQGRGSDERRVRRGREVGEGELPGLAGSDGYDDHAGRGTRGLDRGQAGPAPGSSRVPDDALGERDLDALLVEASLDPGSHLPGHLDLSGRRRS